MFGFVYIYIVVFSPMHGHHDSNVRFRGSYKIYIYRYMGSRDRAIRHRGSIIRSPIFLCIYLFIILLVYNMIFNIELMLYY